MDETIQKIKQQYFGGFFVMSRITVAFSTFRETRFNWVKQLLLSLKNQTFKDFKILLIVNNDVKYFNRLVKEIDGWKEPALDVNVIFNPENLGIAYDRNVALKNASTPIVAFTDDDVLPHRDWLKMINLSFETYNNAAAVTGPVLARWSSDCQGAKLWFPKELYWVIGCSYIDYQSVKEVRNGFASNLALDREVSLRCGGFNEIYGYNQKYHMVGEEPEFSLKLKRIGKLTIWNPQSFVFHRVTQNRLKLSNVLERSYVEGRSKAYLGKSFGKGTLVPEEKHIKAITKAFLKNNVIKSKIYLVTSTSAVAIGYSLTSAKIRARQIMRI